MLRWLQLASLLYLLKCAHLLEENGEGVCNRTDIQTQLITVNQTIIVGTTEVPCTINSWLDQISCSNNVQIKNVTRTVQKTMQVANPVVILYCCPGYNLVEGNCKIITTTSTTAETTMPPTEATTTPTMPTTEATTTTTSTTEATTTTTLPTTETKSLTTTEAPLQTTLFTTQETTTTTLPTTEATTKFETTSKLEIIAITGEHRDKNTQRQLISTKPKHTITTVHPDSIVDDEDMSSGDVDVPISQNQTIVTENDVYFTKVDETIPDSGVAPENRPDDSNIRDILLYVFASCAVFFLVVIVTIICVYKRRSKQKADKSNVVVTLAMDDIISNGNRVTTVQNSCYTEMNENSQNQYTELKHKEDPDYDEIKHVAEQEDHYEKLPGYDESSASPNMNGLMFEYDYEKPVVNLKTK